MKRLILALLVLVVIAAGVLIFLNDSSDKTEPGGKDRRGSGGNPLRRSKLQSKSLYSTLPSYNMVDGNGEVFGSDDLAGSGVLHFHLLWQLRRALLKFIGLSLKSAKNAMEQSFRHLE